MRVEAIVLAAGLSTRFKPNKLLERVEGTPLIVRAVQAVLSSDLVTKIVVVTGFMRESVEGVLARALDEEIGRGRLVFAFNPGYAEGGMSSSVVRGVKETTTGSHVLVLPGDVACLDKGTVDAVVRFHLRERPLITVACYRGRRGHPIVFDASLREELLRIGEETMGLKSVVRAHEESVTCVEVDDPGVALDVDTPEDIARCEDLLKKRNAWRKKSVRAGETLSAYISISYLLGGISL